MLNVAWPKLGDGLDPPPAGRLAAIVAGGRAGNGSPPPDETVAGNGSLLLLPAVALARQPRCWMSLAILRCSGGDGGVGGGVGGGGALGCTPAWQSRDDTPLVSSGCACGG